MVLDVSLSSEPKNCKCGHSYTGALLCDQPNLSEPALQSQAAASGQFSQLVFLPHQQTLYQYLSSGFNLPGIIGAPLLRSARTFHRTSPPNHAEWSSLLISLPGFTAFDLEVSAAPKLCVDCIATLQNQRIIRSSSSAFGELDESSSEDEVSSIPLESFRNLETQLPSSTTTTSEQKTQPKLSSSSNPNIEDIPICGRCQGLFDTADDLLSHKTKNYCMIGVKDSDSEHSCRCQKSYRFEIQCGSSLFANLISLATLYDELRAEVNKKWQ
nr:heterogeneous nuclear ribonucleoprotein C1:C2 [Hymenolepis microstoma]